MKPSSLKRDRESPFLSTSELDLETGTDFPAAFAGGGVLPSLRRQRGQIPQAVIVFVSPVAGMPLAAIITRQ